MWNTQVQGVCQIATDVRERRALTSPHAEPFSLASRAQPRCVVAAEAMNSTFVEPQVGDVVVVRASIAPDGRRPEIDRPRRYAVIEWGLFQVVSERLSNLTKEGAVFEARHCAAERARDAWDSTGRQMVRLPRFPLVYRGVGDTYAVSLDVTDYSVARANVLWQSSSYLGSAEAARLIMANGVPPDIAAALLGKAVMPPACS